jgi:hypothetical protein
MPPTLGVQFPLIAWCLLPPGLKKSNFWLIMGHQLLYLHDAHKNYQKLSPPKQHPQRGHVHFSNLAASIPMCPMSLSFENGPVPSLFLSWCSKPAPSSHCTACFIGANGSRPISNYHITGGINIQTSYDLGYQVRFWLMAVDRRRICLFVPLR